LTPLSQPKLKLSKSLVSTLELMMKLIFLKDNFIKKKMKIHNSAWKITSKPSKDKHNSSTKSLSPTKTIKTQITLTNLKILLLKAPLFITLQPTPIPIITKLTSMLFTAKIMKFSLSPNFKSKIKKKNKVKKKKIKLQN
jgi:hypothetical protein